MWQLGELLRAGWRVQMIPVPGSAGRPLSQVMLQFLHDRTHGDELEDGEPFPVTDWVSLSSFELDFAGAIDRFYATVFPVPDVGVGLQA